MATFDLKDTINTITTDELHSFHTRYGIPQENGMRLPLNYFQRALLGTYMICNGQLLPNGVRLLPTSIEDEEAISLGYTDYLHHLHNPGVFIVIPHGGNNIGRYALRKRSNSP
ncbi:hypothetical protein ACFE04_000522 [Oxalis oulophora]